jgi:FkbM family methyltransferase
MEELQILYGVDKIYVDMTSRALLYNYFFNKNHPNQIILPSSDYERSNIFPDHLEGIVKHICVVLNNKKTIYKNSEKVEIDISEIKEKITQRTKTIISEMEPELKLQFIHKNLNFMHGTINDEIPEQIMACSFIESDQTVLELGSNIGRNTLVISCFLKDSNQLVTLETDPKTAEKLKNNRDVNHFQFNIENSALFAESDTRLLLQKENSWDTLVSDKMLSDHNKVKTITFHELEKKYNKKFDTMVVDCEGSLYYIFQDFPDILNDITTIIMENDYHNLSHKNFVNEFMIRNGFTCIYRKSGGWGPCYPCFYETWKKI